MLRIIRAATIMLKALLLLLVLLTPLSEALGCACGCSVYSVGTRWLMITSPGTRLFFQYSYLDQRQNWSGFQRASSDLNSDRLITTSFYSFGIQYMANRDWGLTVNVPLWDRYWNGILDDGNAFAMRHRSIGDVRVVGTYTGFSDDMSTAVSFGLKFPTGRFDQTFFDRDLQIGTGTTDLLLSAYQMAQQKDWGWYVQGTIVHPLDQRAGYKPGDDYNAAFGIHFDGLSSSLGVVPLVSIVASMRGRDSGVQADPENTGYTRIYATAGVEVFLSKSMHIDLEAGVPFYSHVNGTQLLSPELVNSSLSYQF